MFSGFVYGVLNTKQAQWRTQNFRMGGVEVLQLGAEGCGVLGGSPPTGEGSGRGLGCAPSVPPQKIFRIFC